MPGGTFCVINATCSVSAEEVVGHAVENKTPDRDRRQLFFRDQFRWIQNIELEFVGECLVEQLELKLPFREVAALDGVPKVAPMEIWIGAVDLDGLVPHHRLQPEFWLPVEF